MAITLPQLVDFQSVAEFCCLCAQRKIAAEVCRFGVGLVYVSEARKQLQQSKQARSKLHYGRLPHSSSMVVCRN